MAEKLAPCLCAIPEFAEFCIPLIIDKLFSNLKIAKMDCLNLLCKGTPIFGVKGLEPHLTELFIALKKEIIPGADLELKNASLKAVISLIETISSNVKLCKSFIDDIITNVNLSMYDVQLIRPTLFRPTIKLLECVAMVNKESCTEILKVIVPLSLGQYSTDISIINKVILIETLNTFIKIASDYGFTIKGEYISHIF